MRTVAISQADRRQGAGRRAASGRGGIERLGDVLSSLLQKRAYARPLANRGLAEAWARAAGPRIASRTRVASWRDGTLTVEVASASQRYELEAFHGAELLAVLGRDPAIPAVRRLVFRIGHDQQ